MAASIRVGIADDEPMLLDSFRVLISSDVDCVVVGEALDGVAAVRLAADQRPDVMLMDIRMPVSDGLEATRLICGDPATASVRVVILTMFDLDPYVYSALLAGASGFLLKDIDPADLLSAIKVVAAGNSLFAPSVTRRLIERFSQSASALEGPSRLAGPGATDGRDRLADLTNREREMLVLIATGLSNAQICTQEHISMATVKTHVTRLLAKLNARDRAQLVIAAYDGGLVPVRRSPSGSERRRPPR